MVDSWKLKLGGAVLAVVGLSTLILGFVLEKVGNNAITTTILNGEVLSSTSAGFQHWQSNIHSTAAVYKYFYLWNLTNPAEALQGAKPMMKQVGPMAYRVFTERFNYSWQDQQSKIAFKTWQYYEF